MPPILPTHITQHTLWQALTGELPPLALPPTPIAHAGTDSRDMGAGDLFIALVGDNTDGHRFIADAIGRGAQAVICEEHGRDAAEAAQAAVIDCRAGRAADANAASMDAATNALRGRPLAYIVDDSVVGLQQVGGFQRMHRANPALSVIGITGSVGKTSTKELVYAVLKERFVTLHSKGNLNSDQGLPLSLLELDAGYERAVLEMGMYGLGEIACLCGLARPRIGVITNVGPVHLSRLGSIENIQQAKAELRPGAPVRRRWRRRHPQLGRRARPGDGRADAGTHLSLWPDARCGPVGRRDHQRGDGRHPFPLSLSPQRHGQERYRQGRIALCASAAAWGDTASTPPCAPPRSGWWKG